MPISVYGEANPDHIRFLVARDAVLWRYMDIGKFLDLITKEKMWFTRISELRKTDPYEGALTKYDQEKTKSIIEADDRDELKRIFDRYYEINLGKMLENYPDKSIYYFQMIYTLRLSHLNMTAHTNSVSCWHENQTESDAMWALYARRDSGIAIKSNVDRMLSAFSSTTRSVYIAKVTYDSMVNLTAMTSGVIDSLLIKRHAFRHENEVRIAASTYDGYEAPDWTEQTQNFLWERTRPVPPGVYIECDIETLIEEVVISPLMPLYGAQGIEEMMKMIAPNIPVRRSRLFTMEEIPYQISDGLRLVLEAHSKTGMLRDLGDIPQPPPLTDIDEPQLPPALTGGG